MQLNYINIIFQKFLKIFKIILKSILISFRKSFTFTGRSSLSDFIIFSLFFNIIAFISASISNLYNEIFTLFFSAPYISISIRRLHDVNKSGWYLIIPVLNLIFLLKKGNPGTNNFGKVRTQ